MLDHPHRRLNQLTGEWVLVSPHRTMRPWLGHQEKPHTEELPAYDPDCYLCPGNSRANGTINPSYDSTFVFTNDFSALLPVHHEFDKDQNPLLSVDPVKGTCRVICYSPRHDLTLRQMAVMDIRKIVDVWADQIDELGKLYRWVQIFENKGALMGCSNPHPHGQVWASDRLPNEPLKENRNQLQYFSKNHKPFLIDYLVLEQQQEERIVVENDSWIILVPFWAIWPFETIMMPKRHVLMITELSNKERNDLAAIMKKLLIKYDLLFDTRFPYSMGWHGAPNDEADYVHWQLHAHFYPPLLRSATVKKFIVGYELLAEVQRDITAEYAAETLRELK